MLTTVSGTVDGQLKQVSLYNHYTAGKKIQYTKHHQVLRSIPQLYNNLGSQIKHDDILHTEFVPAF
jgi:hypothetical protein